MSNQNDNNNANDFWAFAFGVAIGAGAAYVLYNTEEGQKVKQKVVDQYKSVETSTKNTLAHQSQKLSDKTTEIKETTKTWVDDVTNIAKEKVAKFTNKVEDTAEETKSSYEKGVAKAKAIVEAKMLN